MSSAVVSCAWLGAEVVVPLPVVRMVMPTITTSLFRSTLHNRIRPEPFRDSRDFSLTCFSVRHESRMCSCVMSNSIYDTGDGVLTLRYIGEDLGYISAAPYVGREFSAVFGRIPGRRVGDDLAFQLGDGLWFLWNTTSGVDLWVGGMRSDFLRNVPFHFENESPRRRCAVGWSCLHIVKESTHSHRSRIFVRWTQDFVEEYKAEA